MERAELPSADVAVRDAYIELLKRSLLATVNGPLDLLWPLTPDEGSFLRNLVQRCLLKRGHSLLAHRMRYDTDADPEGKRFASHLPPGIMTMVGRRRLDNVTDCIVDVIENDVPGDLIETGVWRGGTTMLMRRVLKAYGVTDRRVYVADSFAGLPPPNPAKYPADEGLFLNQYEVLSVSLDDVRANFERYGLLDAQVVFLKGWFSDTLPTLRDNAWSVLRLDGDLYESTMDALTNLYPGLSPGGWIIVDDYKIEACRKAVHDYRDANHIGTEIVEIDWSGICWKKP